MSRKTASDTMKEADGLVSTVGLGIALRVQGNPPFHVLLASM